MAEISKITLPSGNTYDIKDAVAREMISGGVSFIVAWDGQSDPDSEKIPDCISFEWKGPFEGGLSANDAQAGAFYLVYSLTQTNRGDTRDIYDEYVVVGSGTSKFWEKIGDTQVNLTDVVTGVTLTKQTDVVLGEATTFTNASSTVTFGTPTKDTFVKSVTAETNKSLVTTRITPTNGTETVSKVTKTASKLVTTTIPNVTGNSAVSIPNVTGNTSVTANKSNWTFTMGSGDAAETLIIGGGNGSDVTATNTTLGTNLSASKVTLGTAITAATGAVASTGTGSDIVTTVTVSDKTVAKAGSAVTVATGATSTTGTGDAVVTGVTVGDSADAITALPTATAAAQKITVGTNDKVTVLKSNTDVSVTKGNA